MLKIHKFIRADIFREMVREGHTNIILLGDSYKVGHHLQYPPHTTTLHSYFESRGGKFDKIGNQGGHTFSSSM